MSMFSSISSRLAGRASDEEPESDDHSAPEEGAESRSEVSVCVCVCDVFV